MLFVALFKGLVPHAAIASVVMQGATGVVWCAPGGSTTAAAADAQTAMTEGCLCANAGDGAMPLLAQAAAAALKPAVQVPSVRAARPGVSRVWLPPARGPPAGGAMRSRPVLRLAHRTIGSPVRTRAT